MRAAVVSPLLSPVSLPLWIGCALMAAGCASKSVLPVIIPNQRPTVEFTSAPIGADPNTPYFYAYRVFWSGNDPDGRVDHFEYAIDPHGGDTTWVKTKRSEELIFFSATQPDSARGPVRTASQFHILVLKAVDNAGAESPRKTRAFYSYTVAPTVEILNPRPSGLLRAQVVPSVTIHWQGHDPDGQHTERPVYYRFHLFSLDDPASTFVLSDPDSLRRREAATGFADWDSTGPDSMLATYTNLTPGSQHVFVVVAFDEAGAYSPVFSLDENMLQMSVGLAGVLGPLIHIFNEIVDFTYDSGGYTADQLRWIRIEAAAGQDLRFNWDATPSSGANIASYRWAVDLVDLTDSKPRVDEDRDYRRWSRPSPLTTSCTLSGLSLGPHFLYVEARDNNGIASLGVVQFTFVTLTLERELLIVDDTRLEPDKPLASGCMDQYKSVWPSATELDTFLYARGHVPWRCTHEPAAGLSTDPGVFAGYPFDTLGTRLGLEVPTNGVKLSQLARYRNVVWLVDRAGSSYSDISGPFPITALRYMSSPGRSSTLGGYVRAGGRVWLCGGGAASAATDPFNRTRNDSPAGRVYSSFEGELGIGRIMFDGAHWRSAFTVSSAGVVFRRSPRAEQIAGRPWTHLDPWTGTELHSPDYRRLPDEMRWRDPAVDPMPPTRNSRQTTLYYRSGFATEYLFESNFVEEDVDPDPQVEHLQSVLDTLMDANSFVLRRSPAPVMTWYHGHEANRFLFSGFAPWDFHRDDCIALTDFVLQDLWGFVRKPIDRGLVPASSSRPGAAPRVMTPAQRSVSAPSSRRE